MKPISETPVRVAVLLALPMFLLPLGAAGQSTAVYADFNGDSFADLAIGVPLEDVNTNLNANDGAVNVIYGSANGLSSIGNQFWTQNSPGILGTAGPADAFGAALAVGDFNGDGFSDLAIGVPQDDVGSVGNAGGVNVLYGSAGGLSSRGNQFWTQNSPGILDVAELGDRFALTLAAGDFNGDGFSDVTIGVPDERVGIEPHAGGVNVLYGSASGLSAASNQVWTQNSPGILDPVEAGDRFGAALAASDFNGDGFSDLAIGVPSEDVSFTLNANTGAVNLLYGSAGGLSAAGNQFWTQNSPGILDVGESDDQFGSALAAANFGKSTHADLAIGVPLERRGNHQ